MATTGDRAVQKGRKEIQKKSRALAELKIEYVKTDSIKPNDYNPNRQSKRDFDLLKRSITEDGFTQPIIVHRESKAIVDGEHRWRAGRDLGMKEVPVVFVDMTSEQMRISTLRHNRARGSEDVDLGAQVLRDLRELGALDWAQDSLLLDDNELQRLMDDVPVAEAKAFEEYSEGWEPTKMTQVVTEERKTATDRSSMTQEARKRSIELKEAAQTATTAQERAKLEQQLRREIFRINVQYSDDDAKLVREILEPNPAQKLYELCKAKLLRDKAKKAS